MIKKTLFSLLIAALPCLVSYSAKLPTEGYIGPYDYYEDTHSYFDFEEDPYAENAFSFESGGFFNTNSDPMPSDCPVWMTNQHYCPFCAHITDNCDDYMQCLFTDLMLEIDKGVACDHEKYLAEEGITCMFHTEDATGHPFGGDLECPIGGNAIILLFFALPYAIVRLRRKNEPVIGSEVEARHC